MAQPTVCVKGMVVLDGAVVRPGCGGRSLRSHISGHLIG